MELGFSGQSSAWHRPTPGARRSRRQVLRPAGCGSRCGTHVAPWRLTLGEVSSSAESGSWGSFQSESSATATENWARHGTRCPVTRSWNFSSPPSLFFQLLTVRLKDSSGSLAVYEKNTQHMWYSTILPNSRLKNQVLLYSITLSETVTTFEELKWNHSHSITPFPLQKQRRAAKPTHSQELSF